MKRFLVLLLAFLSSICVLHGQKIKYKELYPLLESRQYDLAIPLLRNYLKDVKNGSDANAHLQMAIYMEKRSMEQDILKKTEDVGLYSDSAVTYYQRALDLLTEKQLKKNVEYYRSYERRDVRTGKVGIKIADIQYQLEKNTQRLSGRKGQVNSMKEFYSKGMEAYNAAQSIYRQLRGSYPTEKALYLQSDENLLDTLDSLSDRCEHALVNLGEFKSMIGNIEQAGYDPKITLTPIDSYEKDGLTSIDMALNSLDIWDYSEWTEIVKTNVKEKINPVRKELVDYDRVLNGVRNKITTDSIPIIGKVEEYQNLKEALLPFDPDPLPVKLYDIKIAELEYLSKTIEYRDYQDSSDLIFKVNVLEDKMTSLLAYDNKLSILINSTWKTEWLYYQNYIHSAFGGLDDLEKFIVSKTSFIENERDSKENELNVVKERSKWLIDATDSIPLFETDSTMSTNRFVPIILAENYTAGLYFSTPEDTTTKGYFSLVNRSRIPEAKVFFDMQNDSFSKNNLSGIMNKVDIDESGQIYHLMFYMPMAEQENYVVSLCKIYASDGLAWEKNLILDTAPAHLKVSNTSGDVRIEYDLDSYKGEKELPSEVVLDKKGVLKE